MILTENIFQIIPDMTSSLDGSEKDLFRNETVNKQNSLDFSNLVEKSENIREDEKFIEEDLKEENHNQFKEQLSHKKDYKNNKENFNESLKLKKYLDNKMMDEEKFSPKEQEEQKTEKNHDIFFQRKIDDSSNKENKKSSSSKPITDEGHQKIQKSSLKYLQKIKPEILKPWIYQNKDLLAFLAGQNIFSQQETNDFLEKKDQNLQNHKVQNSEIFSTKEKMISFASKSPLIEKAIESDLPSFFSKPFQLKEILKLFEIPEKELKEIEQRNIELNEPVSISEFLKVMGIDPHIAFESLEDFQSSMAEISEKQIFFPSSQEKSILLEEKNNSNDTLLEKEKKNNFYQEKIEVDQNQKDNKNLKKEDFFESKKVESKNSFFLDKKEDFIFDKNQDSKNFNIIDNKKDTQSDFFNQKSEFHVNEKQEIKFDQKKLKTSEQNHEKFHESEKNKSFFPISHDVVQQNNLEQKFESNDSLHSIDSESINHQILNHTEKMIQNNNFFPQKEVQQAVITLDKLDGTKTNIGISLRAKNVQIQIFSDSDKDEEWIKEFKEELPKLEEKLKAQDLNLATFDIIPNLTELQETKTHHINESQLFSQDQSQNFSQFQSQHQERRSFLQTPYIEKENEFSEKTPSQRSHSLTSQNISILI